MTHVRCPSPLVLDAVRSIDAEELAQVDAIDLFVEVVQVQARDGATKDALDLPVVAEVEHLPAVMLGLRATPGG